MNDRDFEIGNMKFKLSKLDAFKQFHIVRRLGPILGEILKAAKDMKGLEKGEMSEDEKLDSIAKFVGPIMDGLSKLSDQDADTVLIGLCSAVEIQQQPVGNWAKIASGDRLMIQNLELPILLQVAGRAFMYNLSGFFAIAPQTLHGGK